MTFQAVLVALVAATLLPALVFGGWLAWRSAASERAILERNVESKAHQVLLDVEHELDSAKAILTALGSSQFLQTKDFEGFHRQVVDVARQLNTQFALREATTGIQLVNSSLPWGQSPPIEIPTAARAAMEEALRTGKPAVSNVFLGTVVQNLLVSVGVPIRQTDGTVYYLSMGLSLDMFADALKNAALADQWIITLSDRENTVIARSERHDEVVGKKLITDLAAQAIGAEGVLQGKNRFGVDYHWSWMRSGSSGWFVSVGVPASALSAPADRALLTYTALSAPLFVLTLLLAAYIGGRLSQSMGVLGIDRTPTKEEFRVLFESAPHGVLVFDSTGRIVLANEQLERNFGYLHGELIGQSMQRLFPESRPQASDAHAAVMSTFRSGPHEISPSFGLRKDCTRFPIEISSSRMTTRTGAFIITTIVDISGGVESARRLSVAVAERDELRRGYIEVQENERLRLAQDLHDQTGQSLTAAMLELKGLEPYLNAEGQDRIRAVRHSMEDMGQAIHRIAWELRPAALDELGLTSTLTQYVADWGAQCGIETDFHCRDKQLDKVPRETQTTIYRIIQEALTNIAKHATGASAVSVIITRTDAMLRLTIEDNGCGFALRSESSPEEEAGTGFGLPGMRERLRFLSGQLEIESSIGTGTTVYVRIPLTDVEVSA